MMRALRFPLMAAACLVAALAAPVGANVVWDWSAGGGAHRGQFVTNGTSLAAGSFTILDVSFTSSTFMPVGSVSDGTYDMPIQAYSTTPPYTLSWNGSAVVSINAASNAGVNGLVVGDDNSGLVALFGTDSFGSHLPGDWEFLSPQFVFDRGGDLTITPQPIPTPEIVLESPEHLDIADGGSQDFGGLVVGRDTSLTFTIRNTGTASLVGLVVTTDATNDFVVTSSPTSQPVPGPNGSTTFSVKFTPVGGGPRSTWLHIASNDTDENPFDIHLQGTGIVDCVVGDWSEWSPCCQGTQTRTRTVLVPASGGGANCPPLAETRACANPRPEATIIVPSAGAVYAIGTTVFFAATFSDTSSATHVGTWTIGGVSTPATIVEPGSGQPGTATLSHTFAATGAFDVRLDLSNPCGGSCSTSVAVAVTLSPAFPQSAELDGFDRPNGPVGPSWIDETTAFAISSGALTSRGGIGYIEWGVASFGADQEAYVTLSAINVAAPEHNLMLKTQGGAWSTGHIEVSYKAPSAQVAVSAFTPPVTWTAYGTIPGVTFAPGDRFGARALHDGTVQVYRNQTMIGSVSVAAWPYATLGGRIGLSTNNATSSRFDDFGGGDIVLLPVLGRPQPSDDARRRALSLSSAFPNPTQGRTELSLTLPKEDVVRLSILDLQGREVWSAPERRYGPGRWPLVWRGQSTQGWASAGVYLACVRVGGQVLTRRIAIVR